MATLGTLWSYLLTLLVILILTTTTSTVAVAAGIRTLIPH